MGVDGAAHAREANGRCAHADLLLHSLCLELHWFTKCTLRTLVHQINNFRTLVCYVKVNKRMLDIQLGKKKHCFAKILMV
jgi:hypothetical protein